MSVPGEAKARRARRHATDLRRRQLLAGGAAWYAMTVGSSLRAQSPSELPHFRELDLYLAGRAPRMERLVLDLPRIADNGNAVPMRVSVPGPFAAGAHVTAIRLYSERNPVPLMALFEFPVPLARIEVDSRIRLAGTQRVTALAELVDGALYAAVADISVTISGCLDGT